MKEQKKKALASYVKKQLKSGKSLKTLREELEDKQWSDEKISAVFQAAGLDKNDFQAKINEEGTQPEQQSDYFVDPFLNVDDTPEGDEPSQEGSKGEGEATTKEPPHPSYEQKTSKNQPSLSTTNTSEGNGSGKQNFDTNDQETQIGTFKPKTAGGQSSQKTDWSTAGLIGLFVSVFLVVGASSGLAYVNLVSNSPNKLSNEPPSAEEIYAAHKTVDSLHYDTSLHAELDLDAEGLRARDDFDRFKQALPYIPNTGRIGEVPDKLQGELSVGGLAQLSEQNSNGETTIQLAFGGNELKNVLDIELRFVEEAGYVKAKTLPSLPMLPLQSYENQWFSFTASSTPSQLQSMQDSAGDATLSEDSVLKIMKAAHTTEVVSKEEVSDGTLANGGGAYIYTLMIQPKNYPAFMQRVETIISENQPELANQREFQDAVSELKNTASTDQVPDEVGPVRVWVAAESKRLRKMSFEKAYSKQDIMNSMSDSEDANNNLSGLNSATVSFAITLADYNESTDVKQPANTTPIKEAMQSMPFFGRMSSARKSARDARRQTDINQLRTALALYQNDCGQLPEAVNAVGITGSLGSDDCSLKEFMSSVPSDPSDETRYAYTTNTSVGDFCIGASLEDESSLPDSNNDQCVEDLKAAGAEDINYAISD